MSSVSIIIKMHAYIKAVQAQRSNTNYSALMISIQNYVIHFIFLEFSCVIILCLQNISLNTKRTNNFHLQIVKFIMELQKIMQTPLPSIMLRILQPSRHPVPNNIS